MTDYSILNYYDCASSQKKKKKKKKKKKIYYDCAYIGEKLYGWKYGNTFCGTFCHNLMTCVIQSYRKKIMDSNSTPIIDVQVIKLW